MKKSLISVSLITLLNSGFVYALEGSFAVGKHSTNLNLGLGTETPGLFVSGNWLRSNDNGSTAGATLGYNINFGSLRLSPAAKAIFANPKDGKDGVVLALGSGANYQLNSVLGIYGEFFYAPKSFADHLDDYKSTALGVSFSPISALSLRAGYQYVSLNNKNNKDNVLIDGPYLSASINF